MKQAMIEEKKPVVLSADDLAAIDEGCRSEQTEPTYTLEEAFELARKRRKAWMKILAGNS